MSDKPSGPKPTKAEPISLDEDGDDPLDYCVGGGFASRFFGGGVEPDPEPEPDTPAPPRAKP
ncbi:MAG: hypothetical protein AAF908_07150 [Pseudomonadota bacterium]